MDTAPGEPDTNCSRPRSTFAAIVTLLYLAAVAAQTSYHVMWRDELHPWQVLASCKSIAEAARELRYDGVPPLWNSIVYLMTRVTDNPRSMLIVNTLIAGAAVFVFCRFSPFSRTAKALFPLSYFMLFEYGVLARSYALLFLLLLTACAIISHRRLRLLPLTVILFLLMQTSVWGAGFAGLLFIFALARQFRQAERINRIHVGLAAGSLAMSGILFLASVTPGPGSFYVPPVGDVPFASRMLEVLATAYKAFVPIPAMDRHFWNTNILDPFVSIQALLGVVMFCAIVAQFRRRPDVCMFFIAGAAGLLAFAYRFPGVSRHHGHLFMLFIACCWLSGSVRTRFITTLLSIQALAGICAAAAAVQMPFSASKAAAEYIRAEFDLSKVVLAGVPDYASSPMSQWLDRPIYFPDMQKFAHVNSQGDAERPGLAAAPLMPQLYRLAMQESKPVLLIVAGNQALVERDALIPVDPNQPAGLAMRVQVLRTFDQSIEQSEAMRLYLLTTQ